MELDPHIVTSACGSSFLLLVVRVEEFPTGRVFDGVLIDQVADLGRESQKRMVILVRFLMLAGAGAGARAAGEKRRYWNKSLFLNFVCVCIGIVQRRCS